MRLGGSHFYAVNFSRTQEGYSVQCLVFITSLDSQLLIWRRDNILLADFRILTICNINLYILQGMMLVLI